MFINYITQSRAAFAQLSAEPAATAQHISLYVALFQRWNNAHFPAWIMLMRDEVMASAHLGSRATYLNCLRDLTAWGLIIYEPSQSQESVKDIMLALKQARTDGSTIFYNKLDQGDIFRAISSYFERKAAWLETQHLDCKARGSSLDHHAVAQLDQVAPHLVQHMALRIDPNHPNAGLLRHRLSLLKNCERRGLISAEQAAQGRAEVATALVRKPRADWGARGPDVRRRPGAR